MATRIISVNPCRSDIEKIFQERNSILWPHPQRRCQYEEGDIIYMYISGREKYIRFKVKVIGTNKRANRAALSNPTWKSDEDLQKQIDNNNNDLFELIKELPVEKRSRLSLEQLRTHGLNGMSPYINITTNDQLIAYIESVFSE